MTIYINDEFTSSRINIDADDEMSYYLTVGWDCEFDEYIDY